MTFLFCAILSPDFFFPPILPFHSADSAFLGVTSGFIPHFLPYAYFLVGRGCQPVFFKIVFYVIKICLLLPSPYLPTAILPLPTRTMVRRYLPPRGWLSYC